MANGLNTAADVINTAAPLANAIPIAGPIVSTLLSVGGGLMKNAAAKQQGDRAARLREQANSLQKMPLRPEYAKALKAQQMAALYGLPQYNKYLETIDAGVADNVRAIQESSPSGAATLGTISAVLGNANRAKNDLFMKDALLQDEKQARVANTMWNTGDKQMELIGLQRADKRDLNTAAGNLENAATANKVGSIDQILASVAGGVDGITKASMLKNGQTQNVPLDATATGTTDAQAMAALLALRKSNPELFGRTTGQPFIQNRFQTP